MNTSTNRRSASSTRATRSSSTSTRATSPSNVVPRKGFGKGRPRYVQAVPPAPNTLSIGQFQLDAANKGSGLKLLKALPDDAVKTAFFDPQYPGGVKNWKKQRGRTSIQKRRAELKQMSEATIAKFFRELSRVITPSGHVFLWLDNYHVRNGIGHWLVDTDFESVDMITWKKNGLGLGWRARSTAEFLIVLQKKPKRVAGCWSRRDIPSVWEEKVDAKSHVHAKPMELQKALIDATTQPGDLVLDPCAGSFSVMDAALALGRRFIGCDLDGAKRRPQALVASAQVASATKNKAKRTAVTKRRAKALPAHKGTERAVIKAATLEQGRRKAPPTVKPAASIKRVIAAKPAPKVSRAPPSTRAAAVKPVKTKRAVRKAVRGGRAQVRNVPSNLLASGMFVLVVMPMNVLNMLAANEAQWMRPATRRSPRPRAQVRAQAVAA